MRRLLKLWRTICDELEDAILAWLYSSAIARHKPEVIETNHGPFPDSPPKQIPWCVSCVQHWPCDRFIEVQELAAKQRANRP